MTGTYGTAFAAISSSLRWVLVGFVRVYQRAISPMLGPHCRFEPTCSEYLIRALRKCGLIKGLALGVWRILRCNPFCKGGYDPVPGGDEPPSRNDATSA